MSRASVLRRKRRSSSNYIADLQAKSPRQHSSTASLPGYNDAEAQHFRSQIGVALNNLAGFHLFWSATQRRIFARDSGLSITLVRPAGRGRPALPTDAIYVGTYESPASIQMIVDDLEDAMGSPHLDATSKHPRF